MTRTRSAGKKILHRSWRELRYISKVLGRSGIVEMWIGRIPYVRSGREHEGGKKNGEVKVDKVVHPADSLSNDCLLYGVGCPENYKDTIDYDNPEK